MNLTDLSYYLRKYAPIALICLIVVLIFYYSIKLFLIYLDSQKVKPIFLDTAFGKINKPEIKDFIQGGNYSYTIDTIEGKPVTATAAAKVFLLIPQSAKIGYRERINFMAKTLDFDINKIKYEFEGDTQAVFKDNQKELKIDITNYNFQYKYNYKNNPQIFDNTYIPNRQEIENNAINILTKINRYPDELAKGQIKINYHYYDTQTGSLNILPTSKDANTIQVNFYRPDIDDRSIVSPKYIESQNNILFVFNNDSYKILEMHINFFEKSEAQVGVYPIKTGQQAWDKLASGEAMIIKAPTDKDKIIIKKMSLAYLDPDFYQPYLEPVYVFVGEGSFVAYVPAVTDEYLGK